MKPGFRSLIKATFPVLIVVPALMQDVHAQLPTHTIMPDADGNLTVAGGFDELNGSDWTILASGGSTAPFTVKILEGASLTGSPELTDGMIVSSRNYTIHNSGSLNARGYGIRVAPRIIDTLRVSSESISLDNTYIHNFYGGLIQGGSDGIYLSVDGGRVDNDGTITGNFNGISAGSGFILENNGSGKITGGFGNGLAVGNDAGLTNYGFIIGGNTQEVSINTKSAVAPVPFVFRKGGNGVVAGSGLDLTNLGSITGTSGTGVSAGDDLTLTNHGRIAGLGFQGFETRTISPSGSFGDGVSAGHNAVIQNGSYGDILGARFGISAGTNLQLTNGGTIRGTSENGGIAGVYALEGANITNSSEISGDVDGIRLDITPAESEGVSAVFAPEEAPPASTITNQGFISGVSGNGILGTNLAETVNNHGTISGPLAAINLGAGENVINLHLGSIVNGNIIGGEGNDQINFFAGSDNPGDPQNIVHGNVSGVETITKSDAGFAFIGGAGESFNVAADAINIHSGGLIINGTLSSLSGGNTQVTLTGGGQLDGTGDWHADIILASGGISAGSTVNQLNGSGGGGVVPFSALATTGDSNHDSVGTFTLTGDVTHTPGSIDKSAARGSAGAVAPPVSTYIREDINPQTPIKNGVNSDLIIQHGAGNTFDLTDVDLRIAPTDINKTLTNGTYKIIDSESPLVGFRSRGTLGVQFSPAAPETGPFTASESGVNSLNTVLTNYFATVSTTDSAAGTSPPAKAAPASNGSNLVVTIQHNYEGLPGLDKNEASFGAALDASVNSANPLIQDFIAALDYSDLAAVQATLAALDPGYTLGLVDSVVNSNYRLHRLTQEHLAGIRGTGQMIAETAATTKDAKGVITPGETTTRYSGRANAWGSVSYDGQDYNSAGSSADFDGNAGSFTAGIDWLVAPQLVLGLVLDGSKGDFDGQGTSSDIDSFRGALYGTWGGGMGFYSDFLLGYGDHNLDAKHDGGGILGGKVSSNTDANSLQAMWTAGYTMGDAKVKHGPFAGLEYQNVDVDGFKQNGPLALTVGGYDVESFRGLIGYRVNADLGTFRPYASVAYAHEFEDGASHATASFGGAPFRVSGADQSSAFIITAGTGISINRNLTLDVGYRGDIATDDGITSNGGSFGLNYSF